MPYISVSVSIFKPKLHSLSLSLLMEELVPSSSEPLSPQTLASFRSFIINPSTPQSKISSIFETLTRSLQLTPDSLVLNLLSELASRHSNLSHLVFDSVRSNALLSSESIRLAAESLDALASISNTDPTLSTAIDELDDRLFVSLCFGPSVSVRSWLLRNAERFRIGPYLLLTLFLGFTKDPYPYVRKIALDGLVGVSKSGIIEDRSMINGCYCRAIELLGDMEDQVRSAAIRTVSAWGLILVASNLETKLYWSDDLFVKLCSMGRDMSMVVRVEAFDALGKINLVSEDILLQTLSKRVLAITKEKRSLGQCPAEQFEILASNVAGVLVHGLEDEFYEVRKSACHSLRTLTIISAEFAGEALNLLMDVLNDDSMFVRLEALETMLHMATCGHLKVQGTHMHMFLGTLLDSNTLIRSATRKILKLVKLPNIELFRLSFDSLIENLEKHPQDEADIFSVLFHTGCNHGKFVVSTINEASEEIDQASEGKLGFDSARVAALLVLAISAPLSHGEHVCSIPPRIFSYAVTLLGRISRALTDIMDQNALLAYLSQCSISTTFSATELNIRRGEPCLPVANIEIPNDTSNEIDGSTRTSSQQEKDGASKLQSWTMREPLELAAPLGEFQVEVRDEVMKPINLILAKVKDIWPSIHSGFTNEVLRTLRNFKEELATFTSDSLGTIGAVAFTLQYLQELQILELVLLTCTLRLCKVEICCHFATLKKLSTTVSRVESILKSANIEPTIFISEVGKLLCLNEMSSSEASCNPFMFKELLKHFSLSQFVLCGRLNQIKAELTIPDNDSENPLPFVSRLPVGIPCDITLHNTSNENKLWLRMSMDDESTQFVFLDLNLFGSSDEVRKFTYVAPFYKTPNAISFTLRVCMGMECLFEDVLSVKKYGGPERELTYLCQEREVHLSMISEH
ncbi:protein SIEL isoform X2 [Quercus lobata]|uniref:protein SIEL isoform X2 n=1 Tax=Quercus lobata TaxID=97700 RepID=UPI0012451487|nr:protein SIEL isoform X2 [Quercus lobata]